MPKQAVTDEQGTLSCPPFGMPPIFQPCARLESGLKGEPGLLGPPGQGRQGGIQEDTYRAVVNLHVRTNRPSAWQMPESMEAYVHGQWDQVSTAR